MDNSNEWPGADAYVLLSGDMDLLTGGIVGIAWLGQVFPSMGDPFVLGTCSSRRGGRVSVSNFFLSAMGTARVSEICTKCQCV